MQHKCIVCFNMFRPVIIVPPGVPEAKILLWVCPHCHSVTRSEIGMSLKYAGYLTEQGKQEMLKEHHMRGCV